MAGVSRRPTLRLALRPELRISSGLEGGKGDARFERVGGRAEIHKRQRDGKGRGRQDFFLQMALDAVGGRRAARRRKDDAHRQQGSPEDSRSVRQIFFVRRFGQELRESRGGRLLRRNRPLASAAAEALEKGLAYAVAANAFSVKAPGEKSAVSGIENWRKAVEEAAAELKAARAEKREPDSAKLSRASAVLEYLRGVAEFEGAYPDAAVNSIAAGSGYFTPSKTMLDLKASELSRRLLNVYARAATPSPPETLTPPKTRFQRPMKYFPRRADCSG